jgi:hypothetical protein
MHPRHRVSTLQLVLACGLMLGSRVDGATLQSLNIRDGNGPLERCDQLDISFGNRPAVTAEETLQLPVSDQAVELSLVKHGGIALSEGSTNQHEITLCKAAPDDAAADLEGIHPVVRGRSVGVTGPPGRQWVGYLIVRSPRGSRVGLTATNGPIRAESFDGQLTVRTTNGPISLAHVRGTVSARAENGPIHLEGDGGNVSLDTQNGPIGVRLVGAEWQSGDLVARAQNGPLSVDLPDQYRSSVEIESAGHAPWSCETGCDTRDDGSGTRRAHLGEGPTHVRLSTANGPVHVR